MIYILYIPKDRSNRALPRIIKKTIEMIHEEKQNKVNIYLSPGYLGTTRETRKELTNSVFDVHKVNQITILKSMNGHRDDYLQELHGLGFSTCRRRVKVGKDHRKMMVFYQSNCNYPHLYCEYPRLYCHFPHSYCKNNLETMGVLIGSSNFSKTTYLLDNKDEADVLLFKSNQLALQWKSELFKNQEEYGEVFLSESITPVSSDFLEQIRKDIEQMLL